MTTTLDVGDVVSERYRLVEELGRGAMGVVYRAEHTLLGRDVAIKVLHLANEELVARFEREAQLLARIDHPHVCVVTDFGRTSGGALFLVMEHLVGEPLGDAMIKSGRAPIPHAVTLGRQLAAGLATCHEAGVIHRDLKPDNVMVARGGFNGRPDAKIIDFGVAIRAHPSADAPRLTQAGLILGTPAYMSPEQAAGGELDARSDLYALGVILYEAITATNPFDTGDVVRNLSAQVHHVPLRMSAAAPDLDVPPALDALVARLLAKDREARPSSATRVVAALDAIARGETEADLDDASAAPTSAAAPAGPTANRRRRRRRAAIALLVASFLALVVALASVGTGSGASDGPAADGDAELEAVDGLAVVHHVVARDVVDREPRDVSDRFPADVGRVYCHVVVASDGRHREVAVAWSHDGTPRGETSLSVGPSDAWHTWAVKRVTPEHSGAWRCDVRAPGGELLSRRAFAIGD